MHCAYTIYYIVKDTAGEASAVAEGLGFDEYELVDASGAPDGAQLALTLTDDSMAPYFPQGGRIYVQCGETPEEDYSGALHLLAANPARQSGNLRIHAAERGALVCLGRVIYAGTLPRPNYV